MFNEAYFEAGNVFGGVTLDKVALDKLALDTPEHADQG